MSRMYKDVSERRQEQPYPLEKENLTHSDLGELLHTSQHSEATEPRRCRNSTFPRCRISQTVQKAKKEIPWSPTLVQKAGQRGKG